MRDSGIYGLLGVLAVVALVVFLMTPHPPGSTGEKIRQAVRQQIEVTSDRINNGFDAAKAEARRQDR